MNRNTETNRLFNEFMFATENGTLVIDREDFKQIMRIVNARHKAELEKERSNNSFKRIFNDES